MASGSPKDPRQADDGQESLGGASGESEGEKPSNFEDYERGGSSRRLSYTQAVESSKVGCAQFLVMMLSAGGINLVDGAALTLPNIVAKAVAADLKIEQQTESAMLASTPLWGMAIGIFFSGPFSDRFGRKMPTLITYGILGSFGVLTSAIRTPKELMLMRLVIGFGLGFGHTPSTALLSEVTPEPRRMLMRMPCMVLFAVGACLPIMLAALQDPNLDKINWRSVNAATYYPNFVFLLFGLFLLPESPAFLASTGKVDLAQRHFEYLNWLNSVTNIPQLSAPRKVIPGEAATLGDTLIVVFSLQFAAITACLLLANVIVNLFSYGDAYVEPQYFQEVGKASDDNGVSITGVLIINYTAAALWSLFWGGVTGFISRKVSLWLSLCLVGSVAGCMGLALIYGRADTYTLLSHVHGIGTSLGNMVILQIGVEVYPTAVACSAGGFINLVGRIAACLASVYCAWLRTHTGSYASFYLSVGALASVGTFGVLSTVGELRPFKVGIDEAAPQMRRLSQQLERRNSQPLLASLPQEPAGDGAFPIYGAA